MNYIKAFVCGLNSSQRASLGSYMVGSYLFSIPILSYSSVFDLSFIPQLMGLFAVLYAIVDILMTKRLNIPYEIGLYGIFTTWLVFTFFLAGELESLDSLLTSVKVGIITVCVAQLIKNDKSFYNVLFIYSLSIPLVLYLNYETILFLSFADKMPGMERFEGTIENANIAAIYAISIVWASLLLLFKPNAKAIIKPIYFAFISIALFIIFFSGSKKGMIGILLFVLFASWVFIKKNKHSFGKIAFSFIISISLIVTTIYFVYTSPFYYRLENLMHFTVNASSSDEDRLYLFKTAIEIWLKNGINFFFGIGHNNFAVHNDLQLYSHSTISEILVSSGIVGFLLYFSALGFLLKNLYIQKKIVIKTKHFTSVIGCFFFIILILFFNASAVLYSARDLWPLTGIVAAYSLFIKKRFVRPKHVLFHKLPKF